MFKKAKAALVLAVVTALPLALLGCAGGSQSAGGASGEASYPAKDITFLVGSKAGGGYDEWARGLAPVIEKHLPNDVNIIVENDGAANGLVAAVALQNAKPDGYHFNIINSGLVTSQVVEGKEIDMNSWTWLATISEETNVITVSKQSGIKSLEDLKARTEPVKYASSGFSGSGGLIWLLFAETVGFKWDNIYHDGTNEVYLSLIRGDNDIANGSWESVKPFVESGDVVAIATIAPERLPELPDVPSIKELGYPEIADAGARRMLAAPPGLPDDIRQVLEGAIAKAVEDPELKEWQEKTERTVQYFDGENSANWIANFAKSVETHKEILAPYLGQEK